MTVIACIWPFSMLEYVGMIAILRAGGDGKTGFYTDIVAMWLTTIPMAAVAAFWLGWPPVVVVAIIKTTIIIEATVGVIRVLSMSGSRISPAANFQTEPSFHSGKLKKEFKKSKRRENMKKFASILLVAAMALSLVACGGGDSSTAGGSSGLAVPPLRLRAARARSRTSWATSVTSPSPTPARSA